MFSLTENKQNKTKGVETGQECSVRNHSAKSGFDFPKSKETKVEKHVLGLGSLVDLLLDCLSLLRSEGLLGPSQLKSKSSPPNLEQHQKQVH